jgi:Cys-rich repeat protein
VRAGPAGRPAAWLAGVVFASALAFSACSDSFYFDSAGSRLTSGDGGGESGGASAEGSAGGSYTHCMADPDCQLANLHCDQFSGACVECVTDSNCPATSPRCDGALHRCVNCGVDMDCKGTPQQVLICEAVTHTCIVTCGETVGENCPAAAPNCLESLGRCVQCRSNLDCVSGTKRECDPLTGRCTECDRDDECPTNRPRCDRLHDLCVECTSSTDCPSGKPLCDPNTYTCSAAY